MARSVGKAARKPTKRVRMGQAIRVAVTPLMKSYGFENPTKRRENRFVVLRDHWLRQRDGFEDHVDIQWDKYHRPSFAIRFDTTQAKRSPPGSVRFPGQWITHSVFIWRFRWGGFDIGGNFTSCFLSIGGAVRLALRGLPDVNAYLLTGELTPSLDVAHCGAIWHWRRIAFCRSVAARLGYRVTDPDTL